MADEKFSIFIDIISDIMKFYKTEPEMRFSFPFNNVTISQKYVKQEWKGMRNIYNYNLA